MCNCVRGKQSDIRLNKGKWLTGKGAVGKCVLLIEAQSTVQSL